MQVERASEGRGKLFPPPYNVSLLELNTGE